MNIIEIAKECGLIEAIDDHYLECGYYKPSLQAFAQAVIENYKAGLVPVAWSSPNDFHISYKATENYYIPLYALPSGETK